MIILVERQDRKGKPGSLVLLRNPCETMCECVLGFAGLWLPIQGSHRALARLGSSLDSTAATWCLPGRDRRSAPAGSSRHLDSRA